MARKSGLGRGLESLMGETTAELASSAPDSVLALSKIVPNANQPRKDFDKEQLQELADSIKTNGLLQPILVREKGDKFEIVAGERRYQAAKIAKLKEVPVVVREVSDQEIFQLALIENLQRSDLNPIEEAEGYRQLIQDNKLTQEQLGKAVSKSRSAITNALRLLELPKEVQDLMRNGELTPGHARAILGVSGADEQLRLARKTVSEHLSVRQVEQYAQLLAMGEKAPTKKEPTPKAFRDAARKLRKQLRAAVKVRQVRGKNKIEIEFEDEDDLNRIMSSIEGRDE